MIIDKINEALSQRPFALLGLGLLTLLRGETGVIGWFATGLGAAAVLCLVLVLALRAGLIRSLERLLLALSDRLNSPG